MAIETVLKAVKGDLKSKGLIKVTIAFYMDGQAEYDRLVQFRDTEKIVSIDIKEK